MFHELDLGHGIVLELVMMQVMKLVLLITHQQLVHEYVAAQLTHVVSVHLVVTMLDLVDEMLHGLV